MLGEAIRAATRGDSLISPSITRRLLSSFARSGRVESPTQPIDPLTEREEQVLLTIARGRTNAEIARELHISLSTVKTHVASLMAKLGARNRVEVAMWAYESRPGQRLTIPGTTTPTMQGSSMKPERRGTKWLNLVGVGLPGRVNRAGPRADTRRGDAGLARATRAAVPGASP